MCDRRPTPTAGTVCRWYLGDTLRWRQDAPVTYFFLDGRHLGTWWGEKRTLSTEFVTERYVKLHCLSNQACNTSGQANI